MRLFRLPGFFGISTSETLQSKNNQSSGPSQSLSSSNPSSSNQTVDCNAADARLIQDAITLARAQLLTVISTFDKNPLDQDMKNVLWLYFRDDSAAKAKIIVDNLRTIWTKLDKVTFECEYDCAANNLGYCRFGTVVTGLGHIHLCMNILKHDKNTIAGTIIHEGAHFSFMARDFDAYYTDDGNETDDTIKLSASSRLDHADSYSCLVQNWNSKSSSDRSELRSSLDGSDIFSIAQQPPGKINLSDKPKSVRFSVSTRAGKLTTPKGVQYRWSLRDNQNRSYLLTNLLGEVLQEFKPSIESVTAIINVKTRELLQERGVKSGKIIVRATSPNFNDKLLELPVEFL